jgi:DNA-binding NtrC family response regulator
MRTRSRTLVVAKNTGGKALAARLQASGHHVEIAHSGREALERARDGQYLTYFVNYDVDGMDGVEILKEIRRAQPEASVIVTCPGPATHEDEFISMAQIAGALQAGDFHPMTLADMEKLLITATLRHTRGNIKESATLLGIDRSTLYEKIRKYAIPR